jgi:hypothetical protein
MRTRGQRTCAAGTRETRLSKSRRFFRSDYPETTIAPGVSRGAIKGSMRLTAFEGNTFIRGIVYG